MYGFLVLMLIKLTLRLGVLCYVEIMFVSHWSLSAHFGSLFLIASVAFLAENACSGVSQLSMSSEKCSLSSL